jgi:hypothetical protein
VAIITDRCFCAPVAQVVVACLLVGLLLAASHAEASAEPQAAAGLTHRKLQQKPEWKDSECVFFGDSKLKEGGKELHPHDYCAKTGGSAVCCHPVEDKCGGGVTCARGNRAACCPKKP